MEGYYRLVCQPVTRPGVDAGAYAREMGDGTSNEVSCEGRTAETHIYGTHANRFSIFRMLLNKLRQP